MLKLLDGKVGLKVKAESPFDEIFLIDGGYNLVAKSVGSLDVPKVDPGLYKLKFKNGDHVQEQSVLLNKRQVEVKGPRIELSSPVPLSGIEAGGGPEAQGVAEKVLGMAAPPLEKAAMAGAALKAATETHRILNPTIQKWGGEGSELYFYVGAGKTAPADLISSLRLLNDRGEDIKRLVNVDKAALTARVYCPPGFYRLRVNLGELGEIEMPVCACKYFRTSVFLPLREFGVTKVAVRPDLANAGVLMRKMQKTYEPIWELARITEKARFSLQAGRAALPHDQARQLLVDKWQDPMGGILGAHLLLLEKAIDVQLFGLATRNLTNLAPDHPDVRLLRLWSSKLNSEKADLIELRNPPMLAASWRFLDDPWMKERVKIPEGSICNWVGNNLWGQSVWLLWRAIDFLSKPEKAKGQPAVKEAAAMPTARAMVKKLLLARAKKRIAVRTQKKTFAARVKKHAGVGAKKKPAKVKDLVVSS